MLNIPQILCVLIGLFATNAIGANSCRLCTGHQIMVFDHQVGQDAVAAFFKTSIGNCFTGNDYQLELIETQDCLNPCLMIEQDGNVKKCIKYGDKICRQWKFILKVWRYCGNGGAVTLHRTNLCSNGLCAPTVNLDLTCNASVQCRSTCNCAQCGC